MTLKIRLARGGAKKRPYYSIVIADARAPRDGRFLERVGVYNPLLGKDNPDRVKLDTDRVRHWLSVGAQPTDRVARFLGGVGLVNWQHGNNPERGKPGKASMARMAERKAKEDAAAAAAAGE